MNFVAQTNLQLYRQLSQKGSSQGDLEYVHQAYQLALQLFPFLYRPNGKEHLAHAVGTSSILCSLGQSLQIISAGLLHAAYTNGEFPRLRKGPTKANRQFIRKVLGHETEELIFQYFQSNWDKQNLEELQGRFFQLSEINRQSLLIRLADELEKCVDLGVLFVSSGPGGKRSLQTKGPVRVELARKLGYPALAEQLQVAHETILKSEIPSVLCNGHKVRRDFCQRPLSFRVSFWARLATLPRIYSSYLK